MAQDKEFYTGKKCIEKGCNEPAGTAWSPYWCAKHNTERLERIERQFAELQRKLKNGR